MTCNPIRGEASLTIASQAYRLRPTFDALVCAEEELGPLLALVERAGAGKLRLAEIAALFWFCIERRDEVPREAVGEAVVEAGLASVAKPLRALLGEILRGQA